MGFVASVSGAVFHVSGDDSSKITLKLFLNFFKACQCSFYGLFSLQFSVISQIYLEKSMSSCQRLIIKSNVFRCDIDDGCLILLVTKTQYDIILLSFGIGVPKRLGL